MTDRLFQCRWAYLIKLMQVSIACQYEDERWKSTSEISISQGGLSGSQSGPENNNQADLFFVRRAATADTGSTHYPLISSCFGVGNGDPVIESGTTNHERQSLRTPQIPCRGMLCTYSRRGPFSGTPKLGARHQLHRDPLSSEQPPALRQDCYSLAQDPTRPLARMGRPAVSMRR